MKILSIAVCANLLLWFAVPRQLQAHGEAPVSDSAKIVSHGFRFNFYAGLTTERLLQRCSSDKKTIPSACETVVIADKEFVDYVAERINKLTDQDTLDSEYTGVDVRVVCLLSRDNGSKRDTVSFGENIGISSPSMIVNSRYYRIDSTLLRMIAEHVSENRSDILHYLDVTIPKYNEMLEEYYRQYPDEPDRR